MDSRDLAKFVSHPESMELLIEVPLDKARFDQTIKVGVTLLEERSV